MDQLLKLSLFSRSHLTKHTIFGIPTRSPQTAIPNHGHLMLSEPHLTCWLKFLYSLSRPPSQKPMHKTLLCTMFHNTSTHIKHV